jgi:lipoate-protein ligase B
MLRVCQLGTIPYSQGLAIQQRVVENAIKAANSGKPCHTLLLLQHPPTYTVGRRVKNSVETEGKRLKALGAEYHEV